jgi:hypothetical protein
MKSIIRILILPLALLTACVDSLDDYNVDQKRPPVVPAEPLFSAAVKSLADILTTPNVNSNNYRLYVQHWSTTQYLDEPRYVLNVRLIPQNFWDALYRDVLSDLKEARRILEADQLLSPVIKNNQLGQIGIIEAYTWMILVNTFGNVPYSEALDPEIPLPKYDDAQTVYLDALNKLNVALGQLDPAGTGFGNGDFIYSSKAANVRVAHWVKFGNAIKMKMAMVLADNPSTASIAETAVAEAATSLFTSNADNARFPYLPDPPSNNPVSANLNLSLQSRRDFVGAKPFIDVLNELSDPRRPFFFNPVPGTSNFVGGYYGYTNNPVESYSEVSDKVKAPGFEALFLDYAEVKFLLAEAIERGFIAGDAETHYNEAIAASIVYWGGTEDQAATYIAQPDVAYSSAEWKEKIGVQKWIALYNRGWDAWLEWRRLDYPQLVSPSDVADDQKPANQDRPASQLIIPVRMIYPISEQTLNAPNRAAASSAIGGDAATTKLFWDVN